MNDIKNFIFFKTIFIILFLTATTSFSDSGFIFKRDFFVADPNLELGIPNKEVLKKDVSATFIDTTISDDFRNISYFYDDQNKDSTTESERKSAWNNIKIGFSPACMLMTNRKELYSNSDDEQVSKFIDALTSLVYDDSKFKSLETIGKIIEPQINFSFEF
ncbi:MAG: hypothetical protein NTW65_12440 [Deltaproteobacteria bacterium]|nr:hypothetical protein [Deltaproteobacteria bacterium]